MSFPDRRKALKQMLAGGATLAAAGLMPAYRVSGQTTPGTAAKSFRHSVCRWTFQQLPLLNLCREVKKIGFAAIDLVGPEGWPVLRQEGVDSSMCNGAEINLTDGWAAPDFHTQLNQNYTELIPKVAAAGYRNLICFSGNSRGMSREEGLQNCAVGLRKLLPLAEQHGVILHMELLNSKVDHNDYMADHTAWGVELCRRLNSANFKLLYDIYHMQIMEGDVIRTIRENKAYIGHYHTAGVPGRNEIDDSQELYYPAIMRAIAETGFRGYVAQEFIPKAENKLESLAKAIRLCDV